MPDPSLFRRAVTEFAAIVAGVLLALAIDSAWQARQDRMTEEQYLEAAVSELRRNARMIEYTVSGAVEAQEELHRSLSILEMGQVSDSAAIFLNGLLSGTSFRPSPQVSRTVVQDLVNTGNISLLGDPETRRSLVSADTWIATAIERMAAADAGIAPGLDRLVARHLPLGMATYVRGGAGSVAEVGDALAIQAAAQAVAQDPELIAEIRVEFRRLEKARDASESLQRQIEGRVDRVEARLEGSSGST